MAAGAVLTAAACSQTGYVPDPPLQVAKTTFSCVMDQRTVPSSPRLVAMDPVRYTAQITHDGRHATVTRDGRSFRVGYAGQRGSRSLRSGRTTASVLYMGRDAGRRLVQVSVPNGTPPGPGSYAQFDRARNIEAMFFGDCA